MFSLSTVAVAIRRFAVSAEVLKASRRSKLLVYPGVIIVGSVAAAAAATTYSFSVWKGTDNYVTEKEEEKEEEFDMKAFRREEMRKLYKAFFETQRITEDNPHHLFRPMNGRSISEMVHDYEEEKEKEKEEEKECRNFPPSAQCDRNRQLFTPDWETVVKKLSEEDKEYNEMRLELEAKRRGMNPAEYLEYIRHEMNYCKDMCANCKEVELPPGCEQLKEEIKDKVNEYCGKYVRSFERC